MPCRSELGGDWVAKPFINKASGNENMALAKGKIDPAKPTLVRMHVMSLLTDLFRAASPRTGLLEHSMRMIDEDRSGVVVVHNTLMLGHRPMILRVNQRHLYPPTTDKF